MSDDLCVFSKKKIMNQINAIIISYGLKIYLYFC